RPAHEPHPVRPVPHEIRRDHAGGGGFQVLQVTAPQLVQPARIQFSAHVASSSRTPLSSQHPTPRGKRQHAEPGEPAASEAGSAGETSSDRLAPGEESGDNALFQEKSGKQRVSPLQVKPIFYNQASAGTIRGERGWADTGLTCRNWAGSS